MARNGRTERARPSGAVLIDALSAAAPESRLSQTDVAAYAVDEMTPSVVARPATPADMAAILSVCATRGAAVIPRGAGTKLSFGRIPAAVDVIVETGRLDAIEAYDPGDMTLGVQAGARLSEIQGHLAREGQMLPIDPPFAERATIGGVLATNSLGPRRLSNGGLRDLVIGAEVAGVDGRVTKSGGMVVKNVTGYDLHKAHIGALGTLGVVTRVNFKVAPIPTAERTALYGFDDLASAGTATGRIGETPVTPSAVDLIDPGLLAAVVPADQAWVLAVRVSGTTSGVDRQHAMIDAAIGPAAHRLPPLSREHEQEFWAAAVSVAEPPVPHQAYVIGRLSALPSQLASVLGSARQAAVAGGLTVEVAAQAAIGVARLRWTGTDDPAGYVAAVSTARMAAARLNAALVVEAAPVAVKRRLDVWGPAPDRATLALMRDLQASFDPAGVLSPGRFIAAAA